jgi:hypothetical protein
MQSAADVVPPIVVGSDDGLQLYTSISALLSQVEWIDIENGVYGPAFDAAGHRVTLKVVPWAPPPRPRWAFWQKGFRMPTEGADIDLTSPPEPEALVALLRERLHDDRTDLATLLAAAKARFGIVR